MSVEQTIIDTFESFAVNHPVEAYDMDSEAFYRLQLKKCKTLTREEVADVINELRSYNQD